MRTGEARFLVMALLAVLSAYPELRLAIEARTSLAELWDASVTARREHVACVGGDVTTGSVEITRILPLDVPSDSLQADAALSLEVCGPPLWFGTVHTHPHESRLFKDTFSPSDEAVFAMWRERWGADGVFCVLHSDADAHCTVGPEPIDLKYSSAARNEVAAHRPRWASSSGVGTFPGVRSLAAPRPTVPHRNRKPRQLKFEETLR